MSLKDKLKRYSVFIIIYQIIIAGSVFFRFRLLSFLKNIAWYGSDYTRFKKSNNNPNFTFESKDIFPCLTDKTESTPLDPVYFYQDSWGASKIFELKPEHHYDVGSSAKTIGIISQFVPTTMIDIRPIELKLDRLHFIKGSIVDLPLQDNSIASISSLCVVEHIGLGRYGDPIDPWGSEKAVKELKRVVKPGGVVLFSVPVDNKNKIYFNAHRAFTREYVISLFDTCQLIEEKYIYGNTMIGNYIPERGYGIGLFMFKKSKNA